MSTEKIVDASPTKEFFIYMITRDIYSWKIHDCRIRI